MPLWKTKAYNLTEGEVRYAMDNTMSNRAAAKFLKISFPTYKKYAQMYLDAETQKSLYDLHTNQRGLGVLRTHLSSPYAGKKGMVDILAGKFPEYPARQMKKRLIKEGFREECCQECGFSERRVTDYTVPLILVWLDGDKTNHVNDNLKLLCYNCFYLTFSDLFNRKADRTDFKGYRDDD